MKLGIVITTYQKPDGSTPSLLTKALDSIKKQTHRDYLVVVVGDRYDDASEFERICNSADLGDRITYKNLPDAKEREKYAPGTKELWSAGGVNARNIGIDICLESGIDYVCHLDHDDFWHPQHLEVINHTIEITEDAMVVNTCSTYFDTYLPTIELQNEITPSHIRPGSIIHSAACINHRAIPLRYRDVYEETGTEFAADADMWQRMREYVDLHDLKTYKISTLTCYHPTEGDTLLNMETTNVTRGIHTYGPEPQIIGSKEIARGSRIGKFCSIADNLQFIAKGTHMINWVTTYPFQEIWNMDVPLYEIKGIQGVSTDTPPASPIVIGNDVWIASNVKIKQGVTIGDGAVLATECFVTKDVPPYALVGGNPAKIIRYRFTEEQIQALQEIKWWDWEDSKIRAFVPLMVSDNIENFITAARTKYD